MCGISGFISKNQKIVENFGKISNKLKSIQHRGPDEISTSFLSYKDYNIILKFFRLSIIDIDGGHQPFTHQEDERKVTLICNGEIYNYRDIVFQNNFKTKSDCHVILDLYLKYGMLETVKLLDGEFAFVLIDQEGDNDINIYFARDRFGIRPLFYHYDENGLYFSSELKGLITNNIGQQVEPRCVYHTNLQFLKKEEYYRINKKIIHNDININSLQLIRDTLIQSVRDRMNSERPLGCLLSGGLDSSLVAGIASRILKEKGKRLKTFSIGMDYDSPDIEYARKVANYIDSEHYEVIIPVEKWIENLSKVVKQIESYDITTIRATTGQYMLAEWISKNTDIKVLLNGDGSDELCSGYIYFYNAPNSEESHEENIRLLSNIHLYDVLRVDRGISAFGLEARVPFLSHHFVDLYLSIDKNLRNPIKGKRVEKFLLRQAFNEENIIPQEVLWRRKEAFSDGISSTKKSWFEYIQEFVDELILTEEFESINKDLETSFPSKEAYWYKKIFDKYYPKNQIIFNYWMPKWCNINYEPSARIIQL